MNQTLQRNGIGFIRIYQGHFRIDSIENPEDYPELGDPVTVIGTFDTYEEGGFVYMYLKDAYYA